MRRSSFIPNKTYPPLIVDADGVLALPISFQGLKPVTGRYAKICEYPGLIQKTKLPERDVLDVSWQSTAPPTGPDQLCFGIGKTLNHGQL
jgi:hypothetical protein